MSSLEPCVFSNEVLYEIFENLSHESGELFNLLTLNSSYRESVERLLYRNRADWIFFPNHGIRRGFLNTINNNPRLASYVRSYAIIEAVNPAVAFDTEIDNDTSTLSFFGAVVAAIDKMTNLKVFILQVQPLVGVSNLIPFSDLLSTLSKRQLITFKWNADSPGLLSFLKKQPQLQNLHIRALEPLDRSKSAFNVDIDLPNLRYLSGDGYTLEVLMPRGPKHNVSNLACGGQNTIYIDNTTQTASPSVKVIEFPTTIDKIRSLAIHEGGIPHAIQTMCRDLVCLQVQYLPEQIAKASFPLLECIIFTGVVSMESISQTHLLSICSASPSLKVIYAGPLDDSISGRKTRTGLQRQVITNNNSNFMNAHSVPGLTYSSNMMSSASFSTLLASFSSGFFMQNPAMFSSQYNGPQTMTTMASGVHIQGGSFFHGHHTNTMDQVIFNNSLPISYKGTKVEYPHIDTLCVTTKYASWAKQKTVNQDGVEVDCIVSTGVKTIERSIFSDDLLQLLWPTN